MRKSKSASAPYVKPILKSVPATPLRKPAAVSIAVNQDCVDELRDLLHLAVIGKLTGFVYAAMCPDEMQAYDIRLNAIGEADSNRIFAIGMLSSLNHQLLQEVNKQ